MVANSQTEPPRGFPRWAWWTLFLATFMFLVPLTSPWWSTILRGEIPDAEDEGEAPAPGPSAGATPEPVVPGSMLKIVLHTRVPGRPGLGAVEREVPYVRGVIPQIRAAVSELAVGSADALALLPEGARVLDVAYTQAGTVYIDFSPELDAILRSGTEEETIVTQGIVTTITGNFSAVRRVVILVDGKVPKAGHLDLSRSFRREEPFFTLEEEAEPGATPGPLKSPGSPKEGGKPLS